MWISIFLSGMMLAGFGGELPSVGPETQGMSAEELAKVGPIVEDMIREGKLAGANVLVLSPGRGGSMERAVIS